MRSIVFLLAYMCCLISSIFAGDHAITYENGSRFGDRVLGYAQARYLSYSTGIPFLHRPFPYSEYLTVEYQAEDYQRAHRKYSQVFYIRSGKTLFEFFSQIRNPRAPSTLFVVDYFPAELGEWDIDASRSVAFDIPWRDPQFNEYLKQSMKPKIPIPNFRQPDCLNVAVHVRTLSGTDTPDTSFTAFPLKHPSSDYQKRQVMRVYEWNLRRPMYVFLFSDTSNPEGLLKEFEREFTGMNIRFGIQHLEQPDIHHVVQDFFAMQQFDVLVATQSNFSIMAARIGSFDMIIYPLHATGRYPNPSRIDRVQLITRKSNWFPYEVNTILKDE